MKTSEQKSVSPRTKPAPHYCKPPPQENWKGTTGKSIRSYREIHLVLQGNRLGATGKSVSEYWISPLPQCRLKGVDGETGERWLSGWFWAEKRVVMRSWRTVVGDGVGGGGNFFFFMGEGVTMIASSGR